MPQKFKPVPYARQDALIALGDGLQQLVTETREATAQGFQGVDRRLGILEYALLKMVEDMETLSNILVDAGLLQVDEDEIEDEVDLEPDEDVGPQQDSLDRYLEADLTDDITLGYGPIDPEDARAELDEARADDDGMPGPESTEAKAERQAAARARRAAAMEQFRVENEASPEDIEQMQLSPEEAANSLDGVPDEGITVREGRDPFTGEPIHE